MLKYLKTKAFDSECLNHNAQIKNSKQCNLNKQNIVDEITVKIKINDKSY